MLPWLGLALIFLIADQFTKILILGYYQLGDSTAITSFFNIVRVHNTGAAFSSPQATVTRAGQGSHINERILWTSRQKRSITTGSGAL